MNSAFWGLVIVVFVGLFSVMLVWNFLDAKRQEASTDDSPPKGKEASKDDMVTPSTYWRRSIAKITTLFLGVMVIACGLLVMNESQKLSMFMGGSLVITGAQIILWVVGIRAEVLSNTTAGFQHTSSISVMDEKLAKMKDEIMSDVPTKLDYIHLLIRVDEKLGEISGILRQKNDSPPLNVD